MRDADFVERITKLAIGSVALGISSAKVSTDIRRPVLQCKKLELLLIVFRIILKRMLELPLAIKFRPLENRHKYGFTQYPNQTVVNNWNFWSPLLGE